MFVIQKNNNIELQLFYVPVFFYEHNPKWMGILPSSALKRKNKNVSQSDERTYSEMYKPKAFNKFL